MSVITWNEFESLTVSPWMPVSKIPAGGQLYDTLVEKYGDCGVYQVALTQDVEIIGDEFVHELIGYTGKSGSILSRTYTIRQPAGSHGVARYIRENELDREKDVMIRYIYCDHKDFTALETAIHKQTEEKFGKRFCWSTASAGNDGSYSQCVDLAKKLTIDEIFDLIPLLKKIATEKNQENFEQRLSEL